MKLQKHTDKKIPMIESGLSLPADPHKEQEQPVYQAPQVFLIGDANSLMAGYARGNMNEVDYTSYFA